MKYFLYVFVTIFLFFNIGGIGLAIAQTGTSTTGTSTTGTSTTGTTTPVTTPATLPANPDEISDGQLRDFVQKAKASGMSDEQIRQAAIAKGMSAQDVSKLQKRLNIIHTSKDVNSNEAITKKDEFGREVNDDGTKKDETEKTASVKTYPRDGSAVYGSELFNNTNLTFEPNLRIPTPQNYRLGPDDQILVNIYGNSIADWKLPVSPEGNIALPGIGLLNVSGKTIEQATGLITSKLIANHYAIGHGTNVSVSIGNIRSIKVIMIGEIVRPGTITLSSLSTVFAALYLSGGPNNIGSFRQIQVIRNGSVIRTLDVYDFLLRGSQKDNIRLQDGDIIRVPTYKVRVRLAGQVKRPAIYEVLPGETLQDVVGFAGGFTDIAYTASIKATQLTDQDKKVIDIKSSDFNNYIPLRGDFYIVDQILDTYENRVSIFGAVVRPGQFELDKGLTLTQLVAKAAGIRQDAFTQRGFISRLKTDNTQETIAFDIKAILNKTAPDIQLKKEDVVTIPSIFDLRDEYTVSINGEVRGAGTFPYADKMSVEDLIVEAGGFVEGASPSRIEVARRINNGDPNQKNSPVSKVFQINVDDQFKINASSFTLQPFDVVSVYSLPGFEKQRTVRIEGEVLYPGPYTITTRDEKISDLVKRAGGLKASADVDGGRLKRIDKLGVDPGKSKADINEVNQERADRLTHIQKALKDSTSNVFDQQKNDYVGIDLKAILAKPGSNIDLLLEEGDVLRIPKQQQLVKVNGEVLFPSSVVYDGSKSLPAFVNNAGGFSPNALKRRAYVVYANGSVKATHHFLFIKSYPEIKPGSEIIIPKKQERRGISASEVGGIAGALASAAAVLIGVITLSR
jgi:protein involved in polysaccharide export with SLBB domain